MNREAVSFFKSPVSNSKLVLKNIKTQNERIVSGFLREVNSSVQFSITAGIPILLPEYNQPDWTHPVFEILLGEKAFEIVGDLVKKVGREHWLNKLSEGIEAEFKKQDVIEAFEKFGRMPKQKRYRTHNFRRKAKTIHRISISEFNKGLSKIRKNYTEKRLNYLKKLEKPPPIVDFIKSIRHQEPKILLELGCGGCSATQCVIEEISSFHHLFTLDIDFVCTEVAEGISRVQNITHKIDPTVGNFWFLPFENESIDLVFSNGGIAEAREITQTIKQIVRVLKPSGHFVNLSSNEPFLLLPLFKKYNYTSKEKEYMASTADIYPGARKFIQRAEENGLMLKDKREYQLKNSRKVTLFVFEVVK